MTETVWPKKLILTDHHRDEIVGYMQAGPYDDDKVTYVFQEDDGRPMTTDEFVERVVKTGRPDDGFAALFFWQTKQWEHALCYLEDD